MKILLVVNRRITALQYFRQDMPHDVMQRLYPDVKICKMTSDEDGCPDIMQMDEALLEKFDIISYLRQITFDKELNKKTTEYLHSKGKKIIFDIDDWWKLPKSNLSYDASKINNYCDITQTLLPEMDIVTTTTDYLAERIYEYNKNVFVLPNCIDPLRGQFVPRKINNSRIRFGWVGGVHHLPDIEIMLESLKKVHLLKNIQLCLGGFNLGSEVYIKMENIFTNNYRLLWDDKPYLEYLSLGTPAVEHVPFDKPYRRLWSRDINNYADIYNDIDVALVPLEDNPFNRCKSELKLIEAGWMGKPVIASDIPPYSDVIEHGMDGFLVSPFRNNIDWYVFIKKFADNPGLIKEMGDRLQKKIKEKFDINEVAKKRFDLYAK